MKGTNRSVKLQKVTTKEELNHCLAIRKQVFVYGQQVPLHEEIDGKDESSDHYLLSLEQQNVGTARLRYLEGIVKIERVAILDEYQGQGYGFKLMQRILSDLKLQANVHTAKLSAQIHAIPFYEKLGFVVCSSMYLDANIPHKDMILSLDQL